MKTMSLKHLHTLRGGGTKKLIFSNNYNKEGGCFELK